MPNTPKHLYIGQPVQEVVNPATAPSLTVSGTTATLPTGTYYVRYTWVNANGETLSSPNASIAVTLGQQINATMPAFPSGVSSVNVYISTTSGSETKQGSTTTTSYVQSSDLVAGSALPTKNSIISLLYTVPASLNTIIRSILIHNVASSDSTINLYFVPKGVNASLNNKVIGAVVSVNDTLVVDVPEVLNEGFTVQGTGSASGAITVSISGVEVA